MTKLFEGEYDQTIAEGIRSAQARAVEENSIFVINVVFKKYNEDKDPAYLRALIVTPEDGQQGSRIRESLKEYMKKEGDFLFADKSYCRGTPPIILETIVFPANTWKQTREYMEKFIESYNSSQK